MIADALEGESAEWVLLVDTFVRSAATCLDAPASMPVEDIFPVSLSERSANAAFRILSSVERWDVEDGLSTAVPGPERCLIFCGPSGW